MKKCANCKYFDNSKPLSTSRENDKYKFAEPYIGECKRTGRIKLKNDICGCGCYQVKKPAEKGI